MDPETQQKQQQEADQKQSSEQVCRFSQKPTKNKSIRKRVYEDENEKSDEQEGPSVVMKKKKAVAPDNKLHFATKRSAQSDGDTKATMFQVDSLRKLALLGGDDDEDDTEDDEDGLAYGCDICRKPFVNPVVTKCKHYFCVECAVKHHTENKRCYVCDQPTHGTFHAAKGLKRKK